MRKFLWLAVVLLILVAGLPAQDTDKSSTPTTLQGCLQFSKHHYVLTDHSGANHELSGYANKLRPQIGREVEITGKPGVRTVNTTVPGTASSAVLVPVFDVSSVKRLADACQTAAH